MRKKFKIYKWPFESWGEASDFEKIDRKRKKIL